MKIIKQNVFIVLAIATSLLLAASSVIFAETITLPGTRTTLPQIPSDPTRQLPKDVPIVIDLDEPDSPAPENNTEDIAVTDEGNTPSTPTTRSWSPRLDIFARVDGIKGESMDSRHKDEIDVISFGFEGKTITTPSTAASGKPQFSPVKIVKMLDRSSPILLSHMAKGVHIKEVKFTFRRPGRTSNVDILTVTLKDVVVTGFSQKVGIDGFVEEIEFGFKKIGYEYVEIGANGSPKSPISTDIDLTRP